MSTIETRRAPAPAELPAATAWLAAPGEEDVRVCVERWGAALELTAHRHTWELFIAADGHTAGIQREGDLNDLGPEWATTLADLADLLADPRINAVITVERLARARQWVSGEGMGLDPETPARIAATLAALGQAPAPSAVRVERETVEPVVSGDTPYNVVTLRYGSAGLSLSYDPAQPGAFDFAGPRGDTTAAELRELRDFLSTPEVRALIDAAD